MHNLDSSIKNEIKIQDLEPQHQEIANVIGLDNFLKLCEELGGSAILTLTTQSLLVIIARRKIRENHLQDDLPPAKQLAEIYGVSLSSVYNYLKEAGK